MKKKIPLLTILIFSQIFTLCVGGKIIVTPENQVVNLNSNMSNSIILTLTSDTAVDLKLNWVNFSHTTLSSNKTTWVDFQGTERILVTINRTHKENKSRRFVLDFVSNTLGVNGKKVVVETRIKKYPHILFDDITKTPGYQHESESPWMGWKRTIKLKADRNYMAYMGLMYQIENNNSWAEKTKNKLLDFTISGYDVSRASQLMEASLAYDWVQDYLNTTDDIQIRNKLAYLTDQVYHDLQSHKGGGVDTVDYHLLAYPSVATAGVLLSDYENNEIDSTPEDWISVGTSDLFISDSLHSGDKAMFRNQVDAQGKDLLGGYEFYYVDEMFVWFQVYSHYYNKSILEDYPLAKKWLLSQLWSTLPTKHHPNFITDSNVKYFHIQGFLNLVDTNNISYFLNHHQILSEDNSLPRTRTFGINTQHVLYLTFEDTSNMEAKNPSWTSHLKKDSVYQVFRSDWSKESSWLSFNTWNLSVKHNRNMGHNDLMNIDYYAKGNLLISDSGEVKERDVSYSPSTKNHNIIQISDTVDGNPGGSVKGTFGNCQNPVEVREIETGDIFEFAEAEIKNWNTIEETRSTGERIGGNSNFVVLENPVKWMRTILYPSKEYFIVLDYINNTQSRKINNLFHLTSFDSTASNHNGDGTDLNINRFSEGIHQIEIDEVNNNGVELRTYFKTATAEGNLTVYLNNKKIGEINAATGNHFIRGIEDSLLVSGVNQVKYETNEDTKVNIDYTRLYNVGTVKGDLEIQSKSVDWINQKTQKEEDIGFGSEIRWNTTNINGEKIQTHIYSLPESQISVERYWTRIGGYGAANNIDHPLIRYKTKSGEELHRITAFHTKYAGQEGKKYAQVQVTGGQGNALSISNQTVKDLVLLGDNDLKTAEQLSTDGIYSFMRQRSGLDYVFCRNCSILEINGEELMTASSKIDWILLQQKGENITLQAKTTHSTYITIKTNTKQNNSLKTNSKTHQTCKPNQQHIRILDTFKPEKTYHLITNSQEKINNTCPPTTTHTTTTTQSTKTTQKQNQKLKDKLEDTTKQTQNDTLYLIGFMLTLLLILIGLTIKKSSRSMKRNHKRNEADKTSE